MTAFWPRKEAVVGRKRKKEGGRDVLFLRREIYEPFWPGANKTANIA